MIKRLENIRKSKFGVCIYYGYAVALVVTLFLVGFTLLRLDSQDKQIKGLIRSGQIRDAALVRSDHRFCGAVHGASVFWQGVRASVLDALTDPAATPIQVRANQHYLAALNAVIRAADIPSCRREEQIHG